MVHPVFGFNGLTQQSQNHNQAKSVRVVNEEVGTFLFIYLMNMASFEAEKCISPPELIACNRGGKGILLDFFQTMTLRAIKVVFVYFYLKIICLYYMEVA